MSLSTRRDFLKVSTIGAASFAAASLVPSQLFAHTKVAKKTFDISLAEWSLHKSLRAGKLDNLDFAKVTKREFGIDAVEYVNQFFADKAKDKKYLTELKKRAEGEGVKSLLIMIDREGNLGEPSEVKRKTAIENHYKWVEAAKFLGCHSIRVNARSRGAYEEQQKLAADGLHRLCTFADQYDINVIVENHGGLSSNGKWLSGVIVKAAHLRCGTLPDLGNFVLNRKTGEEYDRYKGTKELMPFAKGVSAKTHNFDDKGNETTIDYVKMMKIVLDAGYHGHVGIEYEGKKLDEYAGIKASKTLLERVRKQLSHA